MSKDYEQEAMKVADIFFFCYQECLVAFMWFPSHGGEIHCDTNVNTFVARETNIYTNTNVCYKRKSKRHPQWCNFHHNVIVFILYIRLIRTYAIWPSSYNDLVISLSNFNSELTSINNDHYYTIINAFLLFYNFRPMSNIHDYNRN